MLRFLWKTKADDSAYPVSSTGSRAEYPNKLEGMSEQQALSGNGKYSMNSLCASEQVIAESGREHEKI